MKQENSTYHQSKSAIELEHSIVEKAKNNVRDFAPLYKKYHAPILQFVYLRLDDKDVAIENSVYRVTALNGTVRRSTRICCQN